MINAEDYMGMVHMLTNERYAQFKHRYAYEDLFQVGCIGLMVAARKFDESKNTKFSTYAYTWIKGYLFKYIRDDRWFLARNKKERFVAAAPGSLDNFVTNSDDVFNKSTYLSQLVDRSNQYEISDLRMLLVKLPDMLKRIIKLRYFDDFTQVQVAKILSIPQTTISRYERKALQFLREEMLA